MRKAVVSAVFACALLPVSAWAQSKQSQVGTWKMDASQSDFGSDPAPKSVTVAVLKDTPEMFSWRVQDVDDKGESNSYSWSGPPDGSMHPFMKNGKEVFKQSEKREEDGSILGHAESNGSSTDARIKMSDDGNTIMEDITTKAKDGKELKQKITYHRVTGKKDAKKAG